MPVARGTRHATAPTVPDKARLLDTETGEVSEHWRIDAAEILRTSSRYAPADDATDAMMVNKQ